MSTDSNSTQEMQNEEVEGLGTDEDFYWKHYPIDTFLIRSETRTVYDVLRRISQDQYVLDPEFQREFIWKPLQQSKLIESVLMRIPLPVFYLAEDKDGRMVVVDGLQRLSTFRNFVEDGLSLQLKNRPELNGKKFQDLSPKLKNRIEDCNLTMYVIDAKVQERARLDIFERVNSGVPLTRQQMRNSLYSGAGTRFLKAEVNSAIFLKTTGGSLRSDTMRDREFVNRFCGFQLLSFDAYRGDMDEFLAQVLERMNQSDQETLDSLSKELRNGLQNNFDVFERHAFRKHYTRRQRRSVINASLWDVMVTGLSRLPCELVKERAEHLRSAFYNLMDDEDFMDSITYGTNDTKRVERRFKTAHGVIQEVFDDHPA
ncbi:MAG: DUF262 domain-containing protein [Caldilineaceae bacterium SB0662_bin_9]|uniref:DUF262 domain-containing protein n=1 Tax=Caldilineaceae bacterium SB0662_bin_9 TaxID=2605258 RepID=A0A6B1DYA7_9CHLR|nr:DUF262 domain-containing protein [Caldilineaceae bacterium SB0662_bin_9]